MARAGNTLHARSLPQKSIYRKHTADNATYEYTLVDRCCRTVPQPHTDISHPLRHHPHAFPCTDTIPPLPRWRYTTSGRGQLPSEKFPSPEPLHRYSVQDQLPPNSHRGGFCTHRPRLRSIQPRTSRESWADSPCAKSQTYLCVMYLACWTFPRQQRTRALADATAACRFVLPVYDR